MGDAGSLRPRCGFTVAKVRLSFCNWVAKMAVVAWLGLRRRPVVKFCYLAGCFRGSVATVWGIACCNGARIGL